ncbi:MAG: S8 family serine peptidase [Ignavibacteriales bacterium]|nr:S8 family serine peptidase [Ignavibacteriales bacterium]
MYKKIIISILIFILSFLEIHGQIKKYSPPNMFSEVEIYKDEKGNTYSTTVSVKFKIKTIDNKKGVKTATLNDILLPEIRNLFSKVEKKYGKFILEKEFINHIWGDTIGIHIVSKKPVKIKDLSQYYKLRFNNIICIDSLSTILRESGWFSFVEGPFFAFYTYNPNDYSASEQWSLPRIEATKTWDITKGSDQVKIAFPDGWKFYSNPETNLHNELRNGKVVYNQNSNSGGHGQQTSGVAAALTDNGSGTISSIGFNSSLMFVAGSPSGINTAVEQGAHIINCSWISGSYGPLDTAVYNALSQGVIVVASAGNDQNNVSGIGTIPVCVYPAAYNFSDIGKQVIAVSATGLSGSTEYFTDSPLFSPTWNYSPGTNPVTDPTNSFIDVAAPGISIKVLHDSLTNSYRTVSGTSFSAPLVSGLLGLMRSVYSGLTPEIAHSVLTNTADKIGQFNYDGYGWNQRMGYGRINAYKAIKYLLEHYGGILTQDLTIPSGETWDFQPGVTVTFASGTSLIVNGTLNAVGTASDPIIFDRIGSSGTWGGIVINSGSYGDVEYCNINNASTGIYLNNNGNHTSIKDCEINDSEYYGIYVYNSVPTVLRNKIVNQDTGAFGILCNYYAVPLTKDNLIKGFATAGIYSVDHSGPYWYNGTANNVIKENYYGIYLNYYSYAWLGNSQYNGSNSIYSSTIYDVKAIDNSTANVQSTWWGTYPPNASKFYTSGSSTIDRSNPLSSDPNNSADMKIATDDNKNSHVGISLSVANVKSNLASENDPSNEINTLLELFKKNSNNETGKNSLISLEYLFTKSDRKDFMDFSKKELRPLIKEADELYPLLLELEMHQLLNIGNVKEALDYNDTLEKMINDKTVNKYALFRKGFLYLTQMNDTKNAEKVFSDFVNKYPDDELVLIINNIMNHNNGFTNSMINLQKDANDKEEKQTESSLNDCYPNPFNPTTNISFSLTQRSNLKLVVYDALGREVANLADGIYEAGKHEITFDASKLPSGVYFYNLVIANSSFTKKMILMK